MKTAEEKVVSLHRKMDNRIKVREKRKTELIGAVCAGLAMCFLVLIFQEGAVQFDASPGMYSGAALLFEDVGGYVLVGVLAFTAAVAITLFCINRRNRNR